jgi:hypothetical protein
VIDPLHRLAVQGFANCIVNVFLPVDLGEKPCKLNIRDGKTLTALLFGNRQSPQVEKIHAEDKPPIRYQLHHTLQH